MISAYYLSIVSQSLRDKVHSKHVIYENYEINPLWQKDIKNKTISVWYILIMFFVLFVLSLQINSTIIDSNSLEIIFGIILGMCIHNVSRQLTNICTFKYFNKNPNQLQGKIIFGQKSVYFISAFNIIPALFSVIFVYLVTFSNFALGFVLGLLALFFVHFVWLMKAK